MHAAIAFSLSILVGLTSASCWCPTPDPGCPYVLPTTTIIISNDTTSFPEESTVTIEEFTSPAEEWITSTFAEETTTEGDGDGCWCPKPEPGCPYVPLPSTGFPTIEVETGTPEGFTLPEVTVIFPSWPTPPDVESSTGGGGGWPEPWCPVVEPGCPYVPQPPTGSPGFEDFTDSSVEPSSIPGACSLCVAPLQFLSINEGVRSFSSITFSTTPEGYQTLTLICPSNDALGYSQIEFNSGENGVNNGVTGGVAEATLVCEGTKWLLGDYHVTQVECDSTGSTSTTAP